MKILLLDIETAPHLVAAWGLFDQTITLDLILEPGYTLCWAAKWLGKREVYFDSVHQSRPKAMLKRLHALIEEADAVVTYNGDRFDLPTLHKDFVKHGLDRPLPTASIDLLKTVKNQFRLASNKLDFVLGYFGLGGKKKHKGMSMWLACMRGDERAWKVMERYNKGDVTELEKLYNHLLPWIIHHPNRSVFEGRPVCPQCGGTHIRKAGTQQTAAGKYQRYRCMTCKTPIRDKTNLVRMADTLRTIP